MPLMRFVQASVSKLFIYKDWSVHYRHQHVLYHCHVWLVNVLILYSSSAEPFTAHVSKEKYNFSLFGESC